MRIFLRNKYPDKTEEEIDEALGNVASVTISKKVHEKCSETVGSRNNSVVKAPDGSMIKKKGLDAMDLEKAVNDNWDRNAEC